MALDIREKGREALNNIPDEYLPVVVRWLEMLATAKDHPEIEPEELWLLASGALEKMSGEADDAKPLDNWRGYLDEL